MPEVTTYVVILQGRYATHASGMNILRVEASTELEAVRMLLPKFDSLYSPKEKDLMEFTDGAIFMYERGDVIVIDPKDLRKGA